jgi:hypothetical protein
MRQVRSILGRINLHSEIDCRKYPQSKFYLQRFLAYFLVLNFIFTPHAEQDLA